VAAALLLVWPWTAGANGANPMRQAAERALTAYKGHVPWADFGFASREELLQAQVAEWVQVYRLDPDRVSRDLPSLAPVIRDLGMVEFVVESSGRAVTRVTLRETEDGYDRVGFGGSGEQLRLGLALLPAPSEAKLIRLGAAEFLYGVSGEAEYLVNIQGFAVGGLEPLRLYALEEALPGMRRYARAVLGEPDDPGLPPAAAWTLGLAAALLVGWMVLSFWRIARHPSGL
jgi:hypothetical protein